MVYTSKVNKKDKDKFNHPTCKPIELMEKFIINHTNEGSVVFDPFMGSGSTGVAAKNLNRNFIGIEMDEGYFNIAKKRINAT
jgi:site-specific DNA-methyltransferase (adenine-specific)